MALRVAAVAATALIGLAVLALAAQAQYPSTAIVSAGPLERVTLGKDLSCSVAHVQDAFLEFYPSTIAPGDCGTFLLVDEVTLYAPSFLAHGDTATTLSGLPWAAPWTQVSQSAVTGAGTAADPFSVTTVVTAGNFVTIEQKDDYIVGTEHYTTTVKVRNTDALAHSFRLWRAGDCYLGSNDEGYGFLDPPGGNGRVGCTQNPNNVPAGRIEMWIPKTPGSRAQHDEFSTIWSHIGTDKAAFLDTCLCMTSTDNGAGLSWDFTVAANGEASFRHDLLFRPDSAAPPPPPPPPPPAPPTTGFKAIRGACDHPASSFMSTSSTDVVSWAWDFGDGNKSTQQDPVHTYAKPGTYHVRLVATAGNGLTAQAAADHVPFDASQPASCCGTASMPGPFSILEEQPFQVGLEAPWATASPFAFSNVPRGAEADVQARELRWTPAKGQAGMYPVKVTGTVGPCHHEGWFLIRVDSVATEVPDGDRDGIADPADNCPATPNRGQGDSDHDGWGDACDVPRCLDCGPGAQGPSREVDMDRDADGVTDARDACPNHRDPAQADADRDGAGDACDRDLDGDGIVQARIAGQDLLLDNCPAASNQDQADADWDGLGDACDPCPGSCAATLPAGDPPATRPVKADASRLGMWLVSGIAAVATLAACGLILMRRP